MAEDSIEKTCTVRNKMGLHARPAAQIVQTAKRTECGIALENLKGIRARVTARGGDAKNRLGSWGFAQLGGFIVYKATLAGIPVEFVNPRYTSQTCAQCGHRRGGSCARGRHCPVRSLQ